MEDDSESIVAGIGRLMRASEAMVVTLEEIVGASGVVNCRSGATKVRAVSSGSLAVATTSPPSVNQRLESLDFTVPVSGCERDRDPGLGGREPAST